MQKGQIILELDYAAKMTQFGQDAMPCSAAKQTSNFIVFAHFNPTNQDGRNVTDTTEVFAFHSDCVRQDTHSIRRCVKHVLENLQTRGFLKSLTHIWADGCGAQNKGRKAFRQMSELAVEMSVKIICNFACSHHFAGPWDTEGGRQHRAITLHLQNERNVEDCETIVGAADNVKLLRNILSKAGTPDPPGPKGSKFFRPAQSSPASATAAVASKRSKPQRQPRGRSDEEMRLVNDADDGWYEIQKRHIHRIEPCPCVSACDCMLDGRLTYKRDENYDSTAIVGTLSTYCYGFFRKALHVRVRQFSCYCRWCSQGRWDRCSALSIVRHNPSKPVLPTHTGYRQWRDEGWRLVVLRAISKPDAAVLRVATQSRDAARDYIKKLSNGSTIALFNTDNGNRGYWLARKQSALRKAQTNDDTTGVKRGEDILSIIWYDCVQGLKYKLMDYETVVSVGSVIVTVSKIVWNKTTTSRFYLGQSVHDMLIDIIGRMSEM